MEKRVSGGLAIYYGMGAILASIGSAIGLIVWIVKVFRGTETFQWVVPIAILVFAAIAGFVGYLLLKVGYEEIEN